MTPNWKPGEATWRDLAACRKVNTDVFFPQSELFANRAKLICSTCPVQKECLAWAVATRQTDGIWGGKTADERARVTRAGRRRNAAA